MANVTPAIKRIMTKGEWRFDGHGYLASRIASSPMVAEWRKEVRNVYIAMEPRRSLILHSNEKGLPLLFPILI